MIYRKLGNSDLDASVIALGTWVMGGWMWGGAEESESIEAIHASLDAGVNLIDTAPIYGFGYSEEVVGKALRDRRDKAIIATKCGLVWDKEKGEFYFHANDKGIVSEEGTMKVHKFLGPESIHEEVEKSLVRLQTDYIDLYQTHWQESTTAIEDTMAALLNMKDQGKIRAIGVSNATVDQMKEYGEIDSDQEKYSMIHRKIDEAGNSDYCHDNDIAILAYSPLGQGLLTGKITKDRKYNEGDLRINSPLFAKDSVNRINEMLSEFEPIAEAHDINVGQLSLAWTFSRKGITHLLCGARNIQQAKDNAKAGDVKLSGQDIADIDSIYSKYF